MLAPDDDVYTNHIHADDLARAVVAALYRGRPNRAYNVSDDSEMKMGAWFDTVADAFHLPRPPRVGWDEAERRIAPVLLSFMSESRRLSNARMKRELRVRLAHPTPHAMLARDRAARAEASSWRCRSDGRRTATPRRTPPQPQTAPSPQRLDAYERLMRLDKPIGTLLLLWPTLSALWLAADGAPRLSLVLIFVVGTLVMRSAGCAINDWADRDFDAHVEAHCAAAARGRRDRAVGGAGRCRGRRSVAFLLVLFTNRATMLLVAAGACDRDRLSVLQALLRGAAGVPRHRVLVRHPDGVRGGAATCAARSRGRCSSSTCSGSSPTTPSTRWSTATTT